MTATAHKDAAAVRVFPPAVPLIIILLGVGLQRLWPIDIGYRMPAPDRYWLGGLIVIGAVASLGAWAVLTMRRTGQSENPYKPTTEIVDGGPYRFTRNPMYLQMVLICLGFAAALWNPWIALLSPVCAIVLHYLVILPEERYLEGKFGEGYLAYKRRVRRWI